MVDATFCASLDDGAGVEYHRQFVIYTSHAYSADATINSEDLLLQAEVVARLLPIYTDLDPGHTLKLSRDGPRSIPWFLVNASSFDHHCIVGTGADYNVLLSVLCRPWCVLELSCVKNSEALNALLKFAKLAEESSDQSSPLRLSATLLESELHLRSKDVTKLVKFTRHETDVGLDKDMNTDFPRVSKYAATSFNKHWVIIIAMFLLRLEIRPIDLLPLLLGTHHHHQNDSKL